MSNEEFNEGFRRRTKAFAVEVIQYCESLPENQTWRVIIYQLCKSATSVGQIFERFAEAGQKMKNIPKSV